MTKIEVVKKKIQQSYDKNQGYQEKLNLDIKIKFFKKKLNKVMTKIEVVKKKIECSYDKNWGFQEN